MSEENGDDGLGLSLNIEEDDDIRKNLALNSPKGNGDDDVNLTIQDDSENTGAPTPATQMRNEYGVNSPRGKKGSAGFNGGGVESLVTQVQQPGKSGAESLVTQVSRDTDDQTQDSMMQQTNGGGLCACLSCLWTCCSSEEQNNQQNKPGSQMAETKKPDDDKHLLSNDTQKPVDREPSVSDTGSSIDDDALLPPLKQEHKGKKCLVLDLDETLVHSSFKPIPKPDFIIPVEIDHVVHHVYVLKRPYVDEFLLRASKHYEIVIFTASLSKYADPLLDKLDINQTITHRLFRESCVIHGTAYVKDLRKLGRKLKYSIIVDNSPPSYLFQPSNAVPIASWFDDPKDTQLLDFLPVLESTLKDVSDVRKLLDANSKSYRWLCNQKNKPLELYD